MKKIVLVSILLLISIYTNAQSHDILWQNSYGGSLFEEANAACLTTDNGYVIGGGTFSNNGDVSGNHGNRDFWVIKLDALGVMQWQKCLGGSESDGLYYAEETFDGGYIVGGQSSSDDGDVTGNHGDVDFWVFEIESDTIIAPPIGVVGSISGQDSLCEGTLSKTYSIEAIANSTSYSWILDPDIADSIITNDTIATIYFG